MFCPSDDVYDHRLSCFVAGFNAGASVSPVPYLLTSNAAVDEGEISSRKLEVDGDEDEQD